MPYTGIPNQFPARGPDRRAKQTDRLAGRRYGQSGHRPRFFGALAGFDWILFDGEHSAERSLRRSSTHN